MTTPKTYFHDKLVLFLLSTNVFIALLTNVMVLLRFDNNQTRAYIVQCRANLGIGGFKPGGFSQLFNFMIFSLLVLLINLFISWRIYPKHRAVAVVALALGMLLLILTLLVIDLILARVSCINYD